MKYLLALLFVSMLFFAACSSSMDESDVTDLNADGDVVDTNYPVDDTVTEVVVEQETTPSNDAANEILEEDGVDTLGAESILDEW